MNKRSSGSAYIMVVFVSIPILLAALTALTVSINSRNISARHTDFFGMYELASAANIIAKLVFEEAYMANRMAAHSMALARFEEILPYNYDDGVTLPEDYVKHLRNYLLPMIWNHLEASFGQQGNSLTRQFQINLGTDHVFYGTIRINLEGDRIVFLATVNKLSDNIAPKREEVRGIIEWPAPAERKVCLSETFQLKNLDYFTPWVVELKKLF